MFRRVLITIPIGLALLAGVGCGHHKNVNPIEQVDSKQPDKVLYDRAMEALKKNKYDVARLNLQTLINTYPESEYIARAKLSIGDAWFLEGGTAALTQAENEYKDFQTFFPNMPEAAEAQMKIANIHYNLMEKPDRDYTHAKRAEDELRTMILQYPDSKLIPEAKLKLLKVQEVLAEREFRIGTFYYLRESWPAAIARLKTMTDTYPLYSHADEALFLLGQAYESDAKVVRKLPLRENTKAELAGQYEKGAVDAYTKIVTRYPAMPRFEEAKKRLAEMKAPVPTPTAEMIAQNKAEQESRSSLSRRERWMQVIHKRPDVSAAVTKGEPILVDPKEASAAEMVKSAAETIKSSMGSGTSGVSVQTTNSNTPPPENQPIPRSDNAAPGDSSTTPAKVNSEMPIPPGRVNDAAAATDSSTSSTATTAENSSSSKPKKKKRKLGIF